LVHIKVGNGLYDYKVQAPYYLEYAVHNTYGIIAYNQTIYDYGQFALNFPDGCLAQIDYCRTTGDSSLVDQAICAEATDVCRDTVEGNLDYQNTGEVIILTYFRFVLQFFQPGRLQYPLTRLGG
jgi:hypothetical protein